MPKFFIRQESGLVTGVTECEDDSVLELDSRYKRVEDLYALFPEITEENHDDVLGKIWGEDNTLTTPVEVPPPVVQTSRFSVTEFKTLFTLQEKGAIYASTDPIVIAILGDINTAEYVDTTDQRTIDAVNYLASAGFIESSRVAEILVTHAPGEVVYPPA